jgi:hypothetical protein
MKKLHKIILVIIVVVPLLILWILSDTHKRHYRIARMRWYIQVIGAGRTRGYLKLCVMRD